MKMALPLSKLPDLPPMRKIQNINYVENHSRGPSRRVSNNKFAGSYGKRQDDRHHFSGKRFNNFKKR
jgi:hypothetical protein